MLLVIGGSVIAATMALLAVLLAAVPTGPALLPVVLVLLCVNRVAMTCTLQPLAATGAGCCLLTSLLVLCMKSVEHRVQPFSSTPAVGINMEGRRALPPLCQ